VTAKTRPKAVLFDFGGVFTTSPFQAFNRYEAEAGLPRDFIRRLNARNVESNAWARLERSEIGIDTFCRLFEAEAMAAGHALDARRVLGCLAGELDQAMVAAFERVRGRFKTACLTNNAAVGAGPGMSRAPETARRIAEVMAHFDAVVESSRAGVRKPEPRFYQIACEKLGVRPQEAVFLDDLGVNLKPARAMGMRTIKVESVPQALSELEAVLEMRLVEAT
jgi:putative hydrolase of the HAD superfamily